MRIIEDPFTEPSPDEVPLANAPLVRVIAQVRFPEILTIGQRDFVAPFQEAIRATYPVLRQEQIQAVLIGPGNAMQVKPQTAWRFGDAAGQWRVSLTPEFLALETTKYTSRADFFSRLHRIVTALGEHIEPSLVDRIGIRYIDRITGTAVDDITSLVRPEVRGLAGTPIAAHAAHFLSETMFNLADARVVARWGQLPAGATLDPAAIEPSQEKSWILDIDMSSTASFPFAVDQVVELGKKYAEQVYSFFRWAVTAEFLRRYGGTV